jgi:PmbA protein
VSADGAELLELADRVVARAGAGEQVEAYVTRATRTSVRASGGEVESLEQSTSAGVGVRVVVEGRQGFAYAGTLDEAAVRDALDEARDNASLSTADEANGLADPDGTAPPDLDLVDPALAALTTEEKIELALAVERAALAVDPRITGVRVASWTDYATESAVVTTSELRVADAATGCYATASPLASDGEERQIAYESQAGRRRADVDVEWVGRSAAEKAVAMLGAIQPKSRRTTVVLDPDVVAAFLALIGSTLVGDAVIKGRSLFADRVGQQVAAPAVTLVDDPTNPLSFAAGRHDGEGLASRRTPLIAGGTLEGFLHSTWSARRTGTTSTASAVRSYSSTPATGARALALAPGDLDDDALYAAVGDGVFVQSVSGLHSGTNPVSGDFSVGMSGRAIRDGVLAEPVREATIASTLQRMLLDVVAVGADLTWTTGGTGAPLLAIEGVSLSGS